VLLECRSTFVCLPLRAREQLRGRAIGELDADVVMWPPTNLLLDTDDAAAGLVLDPREDLSR
jgi:hypothetical protein